MRQSTTTINEAADALRQRWGQNPHMGIVLGSGLGEFAHRIQRPVTVGYDAVPHMARTTALGHEGRFVCGQMADLNVITMDGRLHAYEGHSVAQIVFPISVMRELGIRMLVISNASGGLNPACSTGDILIIEDHVDLMGGRRLWQPTWQEAGPRAGGQGRPAHSGPADRPRRSTNYYDRHLVRLALVAARRMDISARRGVYAALRGPNYETRAEYRFLRMIGADVVGMSTVPEVVAANELGLRVLALSVVTNVCQPDGLMPTHGAAVVAAAAKAEPQMGAIVQGVIQAVNPELRAEDAEP